MAATEAHLDSLLTYPHIRHVEVLDRGEASASRGPVPTDVEVREIPLTVTDDNRDRDVGTLRIVADRAALRGSLAAEYGWRFASSLGLLILVMGFTLLLCLDRQVTRHLRHISQHVALLRPDRLDQTLALTRSPQPGEGDELDTLATGIERMQSTLSASMRKLEHSLEQQRAAEESVRQLNAALETNVEQRTRELSRAQRRADAVLGLTRTGHYRRNFQTDAFELDEHACAILGITPGRQFTTRDFLSSIAAADLAVAQHVTQQMQQAGATTTWIWNSRSGVWMERARSGCASGAFGTSTKTRTGLRRGPGCHRYDRGTPRCRAGA